MRLLIKAISLVAVALFVCFTAPAKSQTPVALTDKMAAFSYLLGAPWSCSTNVPAMGDQPAHVDKGTAAFQVAPGNVVHVHVLTPSFSGDYYYGFSTRMNMYWQVSADNMGGHAFLTSSDGRTYTGTSSMGPASMQDTVAYNHSGNTITINETLSGQGPMAGSFDTTCTR
jgi:hypothetical protein